VRTARYKDTEVHAGNRQDQSRHIACRGFRLSVAAITRRSDFVGRRAVTKQSGKSAWSSGATPHTSVCVMQSIIGRRCNPTRSRATALCRFAPAGHPTRPFEASLTGYLPSLAPSCSAKRCLIPTSARRRSPKLTAVLSSIRADVPSSHCPSAERRAQALSRCAKRHRRYAPRAASWTARARCYFSLVGSSVTWPAWGLPPARFTLDDW